jgi:hypothetical protein
MQGNVSLRQHAYASALAIRDRKPPNLPLAHNLFATIERVIWSARHWIGRHHSSDQRGLGITAR